MDKQTFINLNENFIVEEIGFAIKSISDLIRPPHRDSYLGKKPTIFFKTLWENNEINGIIRDEYIGVRTNLLLDEESDRLLLTVKSIDKRLYDNAIYDDDGYFGISLNYFLWNEIDIDLGKIEENINLIFTEFTKDLDYTYEEDLAEFSDLFYDDIDYVINPHKKAPLNIGGYIILDSNQIQNVKKVLDIANYF